jgi:hypothetical protein
MGQKNVTKDFTIQLEWNEHGCPVIRAPERARIDVAVQVGEASPDGTVAIRGIFIEGNADGLRWLSSELLAIAETELSGYHAHLDPETNAPVYRSKGGWWLTISKHPDRRTKRTQGHLKASEGA